MASNAFVLLNVCVITLIAFADSHQATTFSDVVFRRGVPHGGRMTEDDCVATCHEITDCWGVNYVEGPYGRQGHCEMLYSRLATCDPTSHNFAPRGLHARSSWVRPCPLTKNTIGSNIRGSFKQFADNAPSRLMCPDNKYLWHVYRNSRVVNGAKIRGSFTLLRCLDSCVGYPGCAAILYNEDERSCSHFTEFTVNSNPMHPAYCCHYAKLECFRSVDPITPRPRGITGDPYTTAAASKKPTAYMATTVKPKRPHYYTNPYAPKTTTAPRPSTTASPYAKRKPIDVNGCPGPFLKQEFTGRPGGTPVFDLPDNTTEGCLKFCLQMGDKCKAVDFDHKAYLCYYFTTEDPMMLPVGYRQCCTHFIRLDCAKLERRQCYQHEPFIFFSNPNDHNIIVSAMPPLNPLDLSLVDCDGVCFQTLDHLADLQLFTVERGCDRTTNADRHWKLCDVTTDPLDFDKDCRCAFDRCNGINTDEFDHLSCHYSFDQNVRDDSGFQRHGKPTNITYDPVNSARSYSAVFDGATSFIFFPSWQLVHPEKIAPGGKPLLSFTVAMWAKRPSLMYGYPGSIDTMTILSTGTRDFSAIQIISDIEFVNPWTPEHKIRASVYIDNTMHEVSATAPLDQFFFLAFRLDGFQVVPRLTLDIDTLEDLTPEDSLELTNVTVTDELSVNTRGLYLGKQAAPVPYLYPNYFFKGQLDDFFCYDKSLSYHALLALRDLSLPLP